MKKLMILAMACALATLGHAQKQTERKGVFTFDFVYKGAVSGVGDVMEGDAAWGFHNSHFSAGKSMSIELDGKYHLPLGSKYGLNIGLGYRFSNYFLNNAVEYNATAQALQPYILQTYHGDFNQIWYHGIQVPIMFALSGVTNDGTLVGDYLEIGVRPGINVASTFRAGHYILDENGDLASNISSTSMPFGKVVNRFSCEIVLGDHIIPPMGKWFSTEIGVELFFNVLPTIVSLPGGEKSLHEFGFAIKL